MSQSELSRRIGISTSTINDWKKKKINPQADKLVCICKALDMSLADLLCDDTDMGDNVRDSDYVVDSEHLIEYINSSSLSVISDADGKKIVVINDLRFKGRRSVDWNTVETCLKEYIGTCTEILDTNELIYIGSDFPDEYAHSKDTKVLRGLNEYAKANASAVVSELIQIATNRTFSENYKEKHSSTAKYGWYRYDTRFAIPRYGNEGELVGYNIFKGRLVVRHAEDGKLYLYDILRIKKETSKPLE
ncbi:MAG: helix-turn-helix domain-containing protein [Saccharofermentans sp.]|nr:helix-turn-helix domain-containing protein [Saccharofermentans sp.]